MRRRAVSEVNWQGHEAPVVVTLNIMSTTQQVPAPVPSPVSPPGVGRTKAFALSAVIVGAVAFLFGWIPFVGVGLGLLAIVLAVLALKRQQSVALAVPALVAGTLALLVSTTITFLYFGLGAGRFNLGPTADSPPYAVTPHAQRLGLPGDRDGEPGLSVDSPVRAGSALQLGDYRIRVSSVEILDPTEFYRKNPGVPILSGDAHYAIVNYSVTQTAKDMESPARIGVRYVTRDGNLINDSEGLATSSLGSTFDGREIVPGLDVERQALVKVTDDGDGALRFTTGERSFAGIVEEGDDVGYIWIQ